MGSVREAECAECDSDLTADDSITVKYVVSLTGKLDGDGNPVPHTFEEMKIAVRSAVLDSMECYDCGETIDLA